MSSNLNSIWWNNSVGWHSGLTRRIVRRPVWFILNATLTLAAIAVSASQLPPATPTAIPTPTPPPVVKEALEELFWISVDWVGEVSRTPGSNRTLDFEEAKWVVRDFLFYRFVENLEALEDYGIIPSDTFPHCIDVISASFHLVAITQASSPAEAAPHVDSAIEVIHKMEMDIREMALSSEQGGGRHDKPLCDQFEAEKREAMDWPSLKGQ